MLDQRFLLRLRPTFKLAFAPHGFDLSIKRFGVDESHWATEERVSGSEDAVIVLFYASLKVLG